MSGAADGGAGEKLGRYTGFGPITAGFVSLNNINNNRGGNSCTMLRAALNTKPTLDPQLNVRHP